MLISNYKKKAGFHGERMVILPIEAFSDYLKHPFIQRLYLTDIGFFPKATHHYRERRDGAEEYIYLYCTAGVGTVVIEDKSYTLTEHMAICIPPFTRHKYFADKNNPWSILWMHCKGEDLQHYPLSKPNIITFASEFSTDRMTFLFDLLFRVLEANYTEGNFIYISQVLHLILSETYYREKGKNSTQEQNKHVTKVIRYLYQNLEETLTLEDISDHFDLSKSYLNMIFKAHTQHAPIDFFIRLKMKQACGLLRSTDCHIYDIATRLGYSDPYYFSRIFKKIVGISPRQYRTSDYDFISYNDYQA